MASFASFVELSPSCVKVFLGIFFPSFSGLVQCLFPPFVKLLFGFKMVSVGQISLETVDWLFGFHWVLIGSFGAPLYSCAAFHGVAFTTMEGFLATLVAPFSEVSSLVWAWLCARFFLWVVLTICRFEVALGSGSIFLASFVTP